VDALVANRVFPQSADPSSPAGPPRRPSSSQRCAATPASCRCSVARTARRSRSGSRPLTGFGQRLHDGRDPAADAPDGPDLLDVRPPRTASSCRWPCRWPAPTSST
jgi:hypothetical protein